MYNDNNELVDIYIPKKCTATGKVIQPKDHAAVQINIARVDERGVATGQLDTVVFSGKVRQAGDSDDAMNFHCIRKIKVMRDV
mmetsp:Transcript_9884/g.36852  ORF Transcript_9884/g.36852 Transcript_9884/m.36852 type:complete len:83 (-) Transcript_9884:54-302(-)